MCLDRVGSTARLPYCPEKKLSSAPNFFTWCCISAHNLCDFVHIMGDEGSDKLKLYIRLPVNVKDEHSVKELHPDIVRAHIPRQTCRWCVIEFATAEAAGRAERALRERSIKGKRIFVGPYRKGGDEGGKRVGKKRKAAGTAVIASDAVLDLIGSSN